MWALFLISFIALLIIYWLFLISSKSWLNLSCIFSILISRLFNCDCIFFCDYILFSRFLIIFTIIIQNSLSCRYPISSSFFFFFLVWWAFILFLYLLVFPLSLHCLYCCVCSGLSVFWQYVEFSLLWDFLSVGGVVWVACQGFLVRESCVGVLVGGAGFLLSGVQWSAQ